MLYQSMKQKFSDLSVNTIHASDRRILIEDDEDFYCAAAQNFMKNGKNAPLELYINMHDLQARGFL